MLSSAGAGIGYKTIAMLHRKGSQLSVTVSKTPNDDNKRYFTERLTNLNLR